MIILLIGNYSRAIPSRAEEAKGKIEIKYFTINIIHLTLQVKLESESAVASLKVPLFVSKRKQEPALPRPFELPINFSPDKMVGLQEEHLVANPRRKFITAIANSIFRFKSYPTDSEYQHVGQQVIKKWKLLDTGGGCVSNY